MYIFTYLYILPEISAYHLQLKLWAAIFFSGYPYIESTTVLSDYNNYLKFVMIVFI